MATKLWRAAVLGVVLSIGLGVGLASAHEERDVGDVTMVVGFLDEPVFVGQKSGLDLRVSRGDGPIEGLESTLQAEVVHGSSRRALELSPAFGEPGAYRSVFFPTAAGPYTFRIFGEIDGQAVDESFTAGPDTFSEVQDTAAGQFPVAFPATADLARDAEAGAQASTMATVALVTGIAGLIAGVAALGVGLARRRG